MATSRMKIILEYLNCAVTDAKNGNLTEAKYSAEVAVRLLKKEIKNGMPHLPKKDENSN